MIQPWIRYAASFILTATLVPASTVRADEWNERTILTFSSPVMIPGATLQPGSYVFRLLESDTSRHVVQVIRQDDSRMVTTTQAVPVKRLDPKGDVVLKLNPTDAGSPPAIKSWFYPGSVYGHQFVYSEAEAKQIAQRTKTLVLGIDMPGTDLEKGVLRTYDPSGQRADWRNDEPTLREWQTWRQKRAPATATADSDPAERRSGTATMIRGDFDATRVKLDDLESNTQQYMKKTISVDGAVEEVLGPRLFTIDEPNWGDLDGEILVFMPSSAVALVREDDRVTITGTVKPFVRTEVEKEWGWFKLDPEVEIEISKKPILVASRIVGGDNNIAMVIDLDPAAAMTGAEGLVGPLNSLGALTSGDQALVGRRVDLNGVKIAGMASGDGFFVQDGDRQIFVLPAKAGAMNFREGETVSIDGVVLELPGGMGSRIKAPRTANDDIYVYATAVAR